MNTNLIGSRPPRVKETRNSKHNIIKRKKKAQFSLPNIDTVKSLPSIRHERRISPDFVPIFDINQLTPPEVTAEVRTTTTNSPPLPTPRPRVSSLPLRIQPRGEGQAFLRIAKENEYHT